jgi:hypothetical protein
VAQDCHTMGGLEELTVFTAILDTEPTAIDSRQKICGSRIPIDYRCTNEK